MLTEQQSNRWVTNAMKTKPLLSCFLWIFVTLNRFKLSLHHDFDTYTVFKSSFICENVYFRHIFRIDLFL